MKSIKFNINFYAKTQIEFKNQMEDNHSITKNWNYYAATQSFYEYILIKNEYK